MFFYRQHIFISLHETKQASIQTMEYLWSHPAAQTALSYRTEVRVFDESQIPVTDVSRDVRIDDYSRPTFPPAE